MTALLPIRYLHHQEINKQLWDDCIDHAENGLIYAQSAYLDCMAVEWDALVLGDYRAVMPLTWKKKYGFYYLYQPFLCACLGVFGTKLDATVTEAFLMAVPHRFRYWDIYFNPGNILSSARFKTYQRVNHVLSLHNRYEVLYKSFRPSYRQLIRKFPQELYTIRKDIPIQQVIALAKKKLQPIFNIPDKDYNRFQSLFTKLGKQCLATSYGVYSAKGGLLASGVFLFDKKRAYYILAGNHPDGRTVGASHQIINTFVKDHANRQLILDFEGSNVPGIAFFYRGFGAVEEVYPGIKHNRLPLLIKWLKH